VNKEELLQEMRDLVLFIKGKNWEDLKKVEVKKELNDRRDRVEKGSKGLSTCDLLWVDDNYGRFIRDNIRAGDIKVTKVFPA
jgi:hypothetical protein